MTLLCCVSLYFYDFEYQGSTNSYNQLFLMVPESKLILMFLLFLVTAAFLDS